MARIRKDRISDSSIPSKKIIWYIALYIRLSRDDGNDESLSVSNQRKILLEYVKQSFLGEQVLVDTYIDDGQSGTDYERPDFQRMIQDVEKGRINCIICKNLSRAFRNYSDQGFFLENFFPRHAVRFIALADPAIDTFLDPDAINGMEVPINGLMNDRYAYKTSSDIRRTFDSKRRNGEFIGAFAPFGYKKDPENKNRLIVDPEAAQIVQDIFRWYVYGDNSQKVISNESGRLHEEEKGGMSKEGIAHKLNDLGIPNPTAYKRSKGMKYHNPQTSQNDGLWRGTSIAAILKNEMYLGIMVQGKQKVISYKVHDRVLVPENEWYRVSGTHQPIIDKELFDLAQEIQAKDIRRAPGKRQNYLFSGFLKCADCHKSMTRKSVKGRYVYYNCSTYKRKSKNKCSAHSIRLDILEAAVLKVIREKIGSIPNIEGMIEEIKNAPVIKSGMGRHKSLLKLRIQELEQNESIVTDLYIDWKRGDITGDQYRKLKEKLKIQNNQLKAVIQQIQEEITAMEKSHCQDPYFQTFVEQGNIRDLTQGLLSELIKEILIHEDGVITIVFKFRDPHR